MRAPGVTALLVVQLLAVAAVSSAVVLAFGLPLAARHAVGPGALAALTAGAALASTAVGVALLARSVGRPVERLLAGARRLSATATAERLPIVGERGGGDLASAAVAFERVAAALEEERARLAAKVRELTEANRALAEARASVLRAERLATVGRLAAGLAHEVGNPLGAITGYVELARTRLPRDADPELAGSLDRIGAAAQRIDRTVSELLDFARPAPAAVTAVAVREVVEGAVRLAAVQARFRGVTVDLALPDDLPPVRADAHRLGQVLLNLLLNAGDAMEGRGRVTIAARADGQGVALTVADTGPGIPPEHLERVFEPFFTTKPPGQGTGLGLPVSQRILESFGGELSAATGCGGGAELRLRLLAASPERRSSTA
jgi:C4-dicarboxylate-specific signal transduction histidine kinase